MSAARTDAKEGGGWLGVYVLAYLVFLYLPILLIPLFSFNNSIQAAFPLQGFTLEWYGTLYGNSALSRALANSLVIGAIAATGATLCGITVSYMDLYGRSPLAATISAIARLPILIPGVIVGISLLILVNLVGFGPSRIAIVLGHILVALPTTVVVMRSRFAAIPKTIREAALDLGASDWTTFRRVMLPLSLPAIASAFMLAFLISFDEFIVVFFLAGTEPTLAALHLGASCASRNRCRPSWRWGPRSWPSPSSSPLSPNSCAIAGSLPPGGRRPPTHPNQKKPKRRTAMAFDLKSITGNKARAGLAALALALSSTVALAGDKLQYFTWSGYELPDFNKSFLAAHPDGVEASMFGDDDDAFTKVKAGFRPDIAHPCYDKVARWNKEGLLQPIDTKRIKNWDSIFPVFKNLPDLQAGDGKVWMVPWDWGNTSILYRTDLVKNPEAELEPALGQAICRAHGDDRRRARHAGGRRASCRRQSVRHDARTDGQGGRKTA